MKASCSNCTIRAMQVPCPSHRFLHRLSIGSKLKSRNQRHPDIAFDPGGTIANDIGVSSWESGRKSE